MAKFKEAYDRLLRKNICYRCEKAFRGTKCPKCGSNKFRRKAATKRGV